MLTRPEFAGSRAAKVCQMPCRFDHRHLHPEANSEIGDAPLAGNPRGLDHALRAALAKTAGDENPVNIVELPQRLRFGLEHLRVDPVEVDPDIVGDPAVTHRLGQRLVALTADGGEVDEHVRLAVATLDEAVALFVREPLDRTFSQNTYSLLGHKSPLLAERAVR